MSELEQMQRLQQESAKSKERKMKTPSELLVKLSKPESMMEMDETPTSTGHSISIELLRNK